VKRAALIFLLALASSSCSTIQPTIETLCHNAKLISMAAQVLCALQDSTGTVSPEFRAKADSLRAQIDSLEQVIIRQVHEGK